MKVKWSREWPTEPGYYWFYGWIKPPHKRHIRTPMAFFLVEVGKKKRLAISRYLAIGVTERVSWVPVYFTQNEANGRWAKADIPTPPEEFDVVKEISLTGMDTTD